MGPCMGVRRGLDLARELLAREGSAFSLGPLIHNPRVVARLEEKGLVPLGKDELDERLQGRTVILRAHGVSPQVRDRLLSLGARLVDATCPRVIDSQQRAAAYARRGYTVVVAGDPAHGEVVGIGGHAAAAAARDGAWAVVGSPAEAESLELSGPVAVIAQTTIRQEEYRAICAVLARRCPVVEVLDSICPATADRQRALAELARDSDALLVVGGRDSANTRRLLASAAEMGAPCWLVERAEEIPEELFRYERVGLASGASTPDDLVDEIEEYLARRSGPAPER